MLILPNSICTSMKTINEFRLLFSVWSVALLGLHTESQARTPGLGPLLQRQVFLSPLCWHFVMEDCLWFPLLRIVA